MTLETPPGLVDQLRSEFSWNPNGCNGDRSIEIFYSGESLDALANSQSSWWNDHRAQWAATQMGRVGPSGIVDAGAGNGAMAVGLKSKGFDVLAVEPHEVGVQRIIAQGVTAFRGTLTDMAFPNSSVPAIGYFDVLEHLERPEVELAEAWRVLRPGGTLLVTVPAYQWLWSGEDVLAGHQRRYSSRSLRRLTTNAGFIPVRVEYLFATLVIPALLLRRIPFLLRRAGVQQSKPTSTRIAEQLDPPRIVTAVARNTMRVERFAARIRRLPFGLTVAGVFRKESV